MHVEYITLLKDYRYNRNKISNRLFNEIKDNLTCSLCIEKIPKKPAKLKTSELLIGIAWRI